MYLSLIFKNLYFIYMSFLDVHALAAYVSINLTYQQIIYDVMSVPTILTVYFVLLRI